MTTLLTRLAFLCVLSPLACSAEDEPAPNPLATRLGFCQGWAEAACPQTVVDACDASSIDDCVDSQSGFCLQILPQTYDSKLAKQCLAAVKAAYKDADLNADELQVVLKLAKPCDQLSEGSASAGEACTESSQCHSAAGFACVLKLGAAEGTCQEPEEMGPGEACDGPSQICGDNNYCNGENCVAYKKSGAACEGDFQCEPSELCLVEVAGEPGTCSARADSNDPCASDAECQSQYCAIDPATMVGECASNIRLSRSEPLCDTLQ